MFASGFYECRKSTSMNYYECFVHLAFVKKIYSILICQDFVILYLMGNKRSLMINYLTKILENTRNKKIIMVG